MARRPTRAELQGTTVRWLLSIEAVGRVWRWSSSPCEVTDATRSESYRFEGGLPEIEVQVLCTPSTSVTESQPLTVQVAWPDIVDRIQEGHRIRGVAELAWWPEGVDWADRHIVTTGQITASAHDDSSEPVELTILPYVAEEGAEVPDPAITISEEAFASSGGLEPSPHVMGRHYPLVFGSPGVVSVYDSGSALFSAGLFSFPGSPGLQSQSNTTYHAAGETTYTANRVMVAGQHVEADFVTLLYRGADSGSWFGFKTPVVNATDDLGRKYAYADLTVPSPGPSTDLTEADDIYISWQADYTTRKRAMLGDDGSPILGAGGLIDYLLRRSTVQYATAAWLGVRAYLDAWTVDLYLDEPVGPWTWITDTLLPSLPLSVRTGPSGLTPVLWRPDARADEAIDHLRAGSNCARVTARRYEQEGEASTSALYALDADTGEGREEVSMAPEPEVGARTASTIWSREARDLAIADGVASTDVTWTAQRGTAYAVAAWRTALAAGWDEIAYDCDHDRGYLALGDVVTLTDAEIGVSGRPSQIAGITYRDAGTITLHLVVWRSPALSFTAVPLDDTPRPPAQ